MQVKFTVKERTLIIAIIGELDHHTAEYLRQKIDAEIMKVLPRNIIFDFSRISFMDSSGIGIIIGRYRNIEKMNGKAAVAEVNAQIRKLFEMSGLLKIIPVFDSIDEAAKYLQRGE